MNKSYMFWIVVVILIGSGVWYLTSLESTGKENEVIEWKTYTNEMYGIEVGYPSGYVVDERRIVDGKNNIPLLVYFVDDSNGNDFYDCGEDVVYVLITPDKKKLPEVVQLGQVPESDVSGILVGGLKPLSYTPNSVSYGTKEEAEKYGPPLGCDVVVPPAAETWFQRGENYYNITVKTWRSDTYELFEQVTQSFDFVK